MLGRCEITGTEYTGTKYASTTTSEDVEASRHQAYNILRDLWMTRKRKEHGYALFVNADMAQRIRRALGEPTT